MSAALWFLPFATPVCLYVAWSDMARMKIPNAAVLALVAVFALVGPLALPPTEYGLRFLHLAGVLMVGFVAHALGLMGAGDAKFAAAMAPFVARSDADLFATLLAAALLGAFALHRGARALPALRARVAHWESWQRGDFPMGLALGPSLIAYLLMTV